MSAICVLREEGYWQVVTFGVGLWSGGRELADRGGADARTAVRSCPARRAVGIAQVLQVAWEPS